MSLTKKQIISDLHERLHGKVPITVISAVFNEIGTQILDEVKKGESYPMNGIGRFALVQSEPRKARNPRTGEEIDVPARNRLTFKQGAVAKKALNDE